MNDILGVNGVTWNFYWAIEFTRQVDGLKQCKRNSMDNHMHLGFYTKWVALMYKIHLFFFFFFLLGVVCGGVFTTFRWIVDQLPTAHRLHLEEENKTKKKLVVDLGAWLHFRDVARF